MQEASLSAGKAVAIFYILHNSIFGQNASQKNFYYFIQIPRGPELERCNDFTHAVKNGKMWKNTLFLLLLWNLFVACNAYFSSTRAFFDTSRVGGMLILNSDFGILVLVFGFTQCLLIFSC